MGRDAMHTGNQTYQSGFAMRSICSLIIATRIVTSPASLYCQAVPKVLSMITPDYPEGINEGGFVICESVPAVKRQDWDCHSDKGRQPLPERSRKGTFLVAV